MTYYSIEGTLPSGCVHIYSIDPRTAHRLVRLYSAPGMRRRGNVAEVPLRLRTSSRLAKGYQYERVYIGVLRANA